ncbi:sensor histidine kinase [Paenibacillus sophorae]|uniref:histidine kinase n=1 Tax=Paenibacillus sophorae TaxID=1333845 RepID=A0ABX8HJK3_9BACL|nr:hypothetical protein KP014_15075 [Paenibacillus sophorae]
MVCADDGRGFKPGEEVKVFDRFYTGEQCGTGIGLAIAKVVIEGHGGGIKAMNAPDGGAVFNVKLELDSRSGLV